MRISKQIKELKVDIAGSCVYEIRNTTSGKRYIGFTESKIEQLKVCSFCIMIVWSRDITKITISQPS